MKMRKYAYCKHQNVNTGGLIGGLGYGGAYSVRWDEKRGLLLAPMSGDKRGEYQEIAKVFEETLSQFRKE